MRGELRLAAEADAVRLGARPALAGADADQFALELGEASEDGQHQAAVRRGGVGPCVTERAEAGFLLGDRRERVQQVAGRRFSTRNWRKALKRATTIPNRGAKRNIAAAPG